MKDFEIQFSGLSFGLHSFKFEIGDKFFKYFENQDQEFTTLKGGKLEINVALEKKETMLIFEFDIIGNVTVACDLCMADMTNSVETHQRIIGKFSDDETWHEDDLIHLPTSSYKIDLKDLFHEYIMLSLPFKNVHEDGDCDPEMTKELDKYRITDKEESSVDPRWEKLKNLK
ncbi:MAG: YceD family protein [Salibacteraceae bacterium]